MRLLQPLSDIYFGSLHSCLTVLQAGSTTKYRAPLIYAMNIGRKTATALRGLVLFLSNNHNKQFLVNNTIKNLHCINRLCQYVHWQQLDSFGKYCVMVCRGAQQSVGSSNGKAHGLKRKSGPGPGFLMAMALRVHCDAQ
jgi:hypothetical protein